MQFSIILRTHYGSEISLNAMRSDQRARVLAHDRARVGSQRAKPLQQRAPARHSPKNRDRNRGDLGLNG